MDPTATDSRLGPDRAVRTSSENQGGHNRDRPSGSGSRRPSGSTRTCGKCGGPLSGQFVRALESTWHLECFTCHECGKIVASKFFPVPEQPPGQYPLCETDYFRRLNLLCYACGGALRGSYITALDRKYHTEHFTCSVCPTVFGASDSYYEHDGSVYCHYHYSTRFAQRCNGCLTAILKQFVEIYRNGQNQHWHPECYMIHKYWNVRLHAPGQAPLPERPSVEGAAHDGERQRIRQNEEQIEEKVLWIWRTLSAYEEKSATCISDMLLHVSNGAYIDGVMSAEKFIIHVDLLFGSADELNNLMEEKTSKGLSYSREAKLLCKKVVAFFQLLSESQDTGVRRLGVTQELLSLVTGLAHYLKLLIRICLQGCLKLERDTNSEQGLREFLDNTNKLEGKLEAEEYSETRNSRDYIDVSADTCPVCTKPVEDRCFRHQEKIFHWSCMNCERCQRQLHADYIYAYWDRRDERLLGKECVDDEAYVESGFKMVSRLEQYAHLLRVAHARLLATLRTSGAVPHTSDDPNLDKYDAHSGHRVRAGGQTLGPPMLRADTRSKSYSGKSSMEEQPSSYEQTLGDIRRLRSTRMDKQVSNAMKRGRASRVIDGPEGPSGRADSTEPSEDAQAQQSGFHVNRDRAGSQPMTQTAFAGADSIRLDDIPRLVAAEQAKEQRPNANKYARGGLVQNEPKPRLLEGHRRDTSGGHELEKLGPEGLRPKRFFSELSALEYFIVRHVAVLSMEPLLAGHFNQEELLDLIEMRKPTFWGKFGKAFNKDKPKAGRKKGVFGVALEALVEKDGEESSDGVGPGALKIPAMVQDAVAAMRTMDMSMEGVFRKNGNIKKLKDIAEAMDARGTSSAVDLNNETPVQVAALLKKFLRELPDPVMTHKLHRLFVTSQKIQDEDVQRRVLHLTCCLLPKVHRDTMEVLFTFLNWVASFSAVDEESGSKMDIHNLATVIAPNVLLSNNKIESMDDSFLGIEAVHQLLQYNDLMSEVPEDLQSILNDSSLHTGSADITTKEILKRYADIGRATVPQPSVASVPSSGQNYSDRNGSGQQASGNEVRRGSQGSAPVVTRVDERPQQPTAWRAETSIRPVPSSSQNPSGPPHHTQTPPPQHAPPNGFYANPTTSSSHESFSVNNNSPNRYGGRYGREPAQYQPSPQQQYHPPNGMGVT